MKINQIGSLTELISEEGKFITQSGSNQHYNRQFYKRKILVGGESISQYRDAELSEKNSYDALPPP